MDTSRKKDTRIEPELAQETAKSQSSALDRQEGGDHYSKLSIQPMEYSMANGLDACQHSIIKYVTRFRDKGGVADLRKALHVIEMLIEFETKKEWDKAKEEKATVLGQWGAQADTHGAKGGSPLEHQARWMREALRPMPSPWGAHAEDLSTVYGAPFFRS